MPRPAKGARLWLRPEERHPDRTLRKRAVWVIRDGPRKISTGCAAEDRAGAERVLGEYLANKYQPNRVRGRHPSEILIADVLSIYLTDVAPQHAREGETKQRVLTLDAWWADRTLADLNGIITIAAPTLITAPRSPGNALSRKRRGTRPAW